MSRYVDADAYAAEMKIRQDACRELIYAAEAECNEEMYDRNSAKFGVFVEAKLTLDAMATVDAVQVVRCKECKYWNRFTRVTFKDERKGLCEYRDHIMASKEDFYCADGERRTSDGTEA